jgi:hypothetical protein
MRYDSCESDRCRTRDDDAEFGRHGGRHTRRGSAQERKRQPVSRRNRPKTDDEKFEWDMTLALVLVVVIAIVLFVTFDLWVLIRNSSGGCTS